jgi:hypothetical protein
MATTYEDQSPTGGAATIDAGYSPPAIVALGTLAELTEGNHKNPHENDPGMTDCCASKS